MLLRTLPLLCCAGLALAALPDCDGDIGGTTFSLSDMALDTGAYKYTGSSSGGGVLTEYKYTMNICKKVNSDGKCTSDGAMVCQKNMDGSFGAVIAYWSASKTPAPKLSLISSSAPEKGVKMSFTNGDKCYVNPTTNQVRKANVNLHCDSGAAVPTKFKLSEESSTCTFTIDITSPDACPGGGMSGGTLFLILLLVSFLVYLGVGIFLQHRKGATGSELMPNLAFWKDLPNLVKTGIQFTVAKAKGARGGGAASGYEDL
jgi:hypothetical protein